MAEKKNLIECCEFVEGDATSIELYFGANIEYPRAAAATFKLQSCVLQLPCQKLPGKLITFCKAFPESHT